MIEYLKIKNVGPAQEMEVSWAKRINLITGDNGLGKSFLLDLAWWALTRTWANSPALPLGESAATIEYGIKGTTGSASPVISKYKFDESAWSLKQSRPTIPGIVVYIRVDGGFSVWDPARNYWRSDKDRPASYQFNPEDVWSGLDVNGTRVCEGLERDWVNWQESRKPQFAALEAVLRELSPDGEPLRAGPPQRLYVGEGRDRPTLLIGNQTVPIALASAGVRRILALAYFLVWAWYEHGTAAHLLKKAREHRFVILFDEPETHLHPRWQRTLMPSLLAAIDKLREGEEQDTLSQLLIATHSPLVAASLEPIFDTKYDDLLHLGINSDTGKVCLTQGHWAAQGDASSWLVSDVFGLEQARSLQAERAIEAAEAFMRGEHPLPKGFKSKRAIHEALQRLLPAHDKFWPRWLIDSGELKLSKVRGK